MRYAIVESGGKQYRAVEGRTIEVDRLPLETGKKFDFERVLLVADGDEVMVGTPTVSEFEVKVTVKDHIKGPKIDRFKYRPKKRIRVRGGHRQQYTLLMVDFIGKPGEERTITEPKVEKPEEQTEVTVEAAEPAKKTRAAKPAKVDAKPAAAKKAPAAKKPAAPKSSPKKK